MDRFPEAFDRFEEKYSTKLDEIENLDDLIKLFKEWQTEKERSRGSYITPSQIDALEKEGLDRGYLREAEEPEVLEPEYEPEEKYLNYIIENYGFGERYRDIKSGRFIKKP